MENQDPARPTADAGRRAAAYWFDDGLPEIVLAVPLILMGAVPLLSRLYLSNAWMRILSGTAFLSVFAVLAFHRQVLDLAKARITYPRTGYVHPPMQQGVIGSAEVLELRLDRPGAPAPSQNVTRFPLYIIVLFFGIAHPLVSLLGGDWSLPAVMGVISVLVYLLHRDSEPAYSFWSVLPLAVSGFLPLVIGTPERIRPLLPSLFGGTWLLGRGAWALSRYLHDHPRPQAMEQLSK
jgi:hypothetical protein